MLLLWLVRRGVQTQTGLRRSLCARTRLPEGINIFFVKFDFVTFYTVPGWIALKPDEVCENWLLVWYKWLIVWLLLLYLSRIIYHEIKVGNDFARTAMYPEQPGGDCLGALHRCNFCQVWSIKSSWRATTSAVSWSAIIYYGVKRLDMPTCYFNALQIVTASTSVNTFDISEPFLGRRACRAPHGHGPRRQE